MKLRILSLLIVALMMTECGPTQKITGSWSDPEFKTFGPYKKAFVIVLSQNKDANYELETQMSKVLRERGFEVVRSTDIFLPGMKITEDYTMEQFTESIKKRGCDVVLTLGLLDAKIVETYNPGTSYYPMNYGYYGSYYSYYNYYYPQVYSPGYYSVDKTLYLETNLYDVASNKLLWSVQSEARNPRSIQEDFKTYSYILINHLKSKGLNQK
jgi:hypothetical protein